MLTFAPSQYVIQWVVEKGETADKSKVVSQIFGQVLVLAQQKFASNVIEKCVMHATAEERSRIVDEVLTPAPDGSSVVKAMLVHPYANYVMQSRLRFKEFLALVADSLTYSQRYSTPLPVRNVKPCSMRRACSSPTFASTHPPTLSISSPVSAALVPCDEHR